MDALAEEFLASPAFSIDHDIGVGLRIGNGSFDGILQDITAPDNGRKTVFCLAAFGVQLSAQFFFRLLNLCGVKESHHIAYYFSAQQHADPAERDLSVVVFNDFLGGVFFSRRKGGDLRRMQSVFDIQP